MRDVGELLVESGQITAEELKQTLQEAKKTAETTATVLLRLGLVTEENLKTVLELHYGVKYLDLKKVTPDPTIISLLPQKLALRYGLVPVLYAGNRLTLAMVTPSDEEALSKANEYLKDWQLSVAVCTDDGFQNFISRAYNPAEHGAEPAAKPVSKPVSKPIAKPVAKPVPKLAPTPVLKPIPEPFPEPAAEPVGAVSKPANFIELVEGYGTDAVLVESQLGQGVDENRTIVLLSHHIISNAISKGCTNIHIEPNDRQVLVHYRKEGVLFAARKLPRSILPDLVKRFKVMAAQAEDEGVLPYDGLLNVRHGHTNFSFRLSIVPGAFGEHLVIWLG